MVVSVLPVTVVVAAVSVAIMVAVKIVVAAAVVVTSNLLTHQRLGHETTEVDTILKRLWYCSCGVNSLFNVECFSMALHPSNRSAE